MEIWDIYTKNREKTGRTSVRGKTLKPGEFHLVVFAFIINKKNEILISRRTMNKTFPGCWEITGGSALRGETSKTAIIREVKEELGVNVSLNKGHRFKTHIGKSYASYIADTYIFFEDVKLRDVVCQKEEVSEAKYVTLAMFHKMLKENQFTTNTFIYEPLYQVIVEIYFRAWLANDYKRFTELLHEDIVIEECTGDTYQGALACETWFKKWNKPGNQVTSWDIKKTISGSLNHEIIVEWTFVCDYEFKSYSFDGCSIFEFKEHKIISLKEFQMKKKKNYPYN